MSPRYNIAPSLSIPIIKGPLSHLAFAHWGFVPGWAKVEDSLKHINARLETLTAKPSFRTAFAKHRCLIPASGYYEWITIGEKKQPYYIYLKNRSLFAFAGLWSTHETCAIVTLDAPEFLAKIHVRMPAIVKPEAYDDWLNQSSLEKAKACLMTVDPQMIGFHPVTPRMNNPRYEGKACTLSL